MKISPQVRSVAIMVGTLFLFSGVAGGVLHFFQNYEEEKVHNLECRVKKIIQTGPEKGALPTAYLTELLDISVDHPIPTALFDEEEGRKNLLKSPLLEKAIVKKIGSDTIYIDYSIRQPIAFIADFENRVIDASGYLFPLAPFYTPKKLPQIYLGLDAYVERVEGRKIALALSLLKLISEHFTDPSIVLKWIDVSEAFSDSYGKREIVLIFQKGERNHHIRLNPKNYAANLGSYLSLKDELWQEEIDRVIDLRISELAYIERVSKN